MAFGNQGAGFQNPPVGGQGVIERVAFQSDNYVPGVSGWAIFRSGNVEFNSGVFRGTVTAGTFEGSNFEINQSGFFMYSGTPALGNLVLSITQTAGTDSHGNVFRAGVQVGQASGTQALMGISLGRGIFAMPLNNALFTSSPVIEGQLGSGTHGTFGQLSMQSAVTAALQDNVTLNLNSSDSVGTSNGNMSYFDALGHGIQGAFWDNTGFNMIGNATGVIPGTNPAQNDNWNLMTTINGWSWFGAGETEPFYKALAAPEKAIQVVGRITHAAITGNSTFWSVPSAYQNVNNTNQIFGSCIINAATNAYPTQATQAKMRIAGSALEFVGLPAGTTDVSFEGYYFLDV